MNNEIEIIERSSGFWIVDENGVIDGPFSELEDAQRMVNK